MNIINYGEEIRRGSDTRFCSPKIPRRIEVRFWWSRERWLWRRWIGGQKWWLNLSLTPWSCLTQIQIIRSRQREGGDINLFYIFSLMIMNVTVFICVPATAKVSKHIVCHLEHISLCVCVCVWEREREGSLTKSEVRNRRDGRFTDQSFVLLH